MVGTPENPTPWNPEEPVELKWHESDHGKPRTYNLGCRCDLCKKGNAEKMRKFRKSILGKSYALRERALKLASKRLEKNHPTEFAQLYREELKNITEQGDK